MQSIILRLLLCFPKFSGHIYYICCLLILFYIPLLLSSIYLADVRTFAAVVICDCPVDRLPLHPRINRSYQATHSKTFKTYIYPARRACALRALGLLLADGAPTVGRGKTF